MKEVFKIDDRVFDLKYGWGVINDSRCPIIVRFSEYTVSYAKKDLKTLSFTEYTLQGFSQERPIVLPEVGDLCLVRDSKDAVWKSRNFKKFTTCFLDTNGEPWEEFKRIKILD